MPRLPLAFLIAATLVITGCSSTEKGEQDELKGKDKRDESDLFSGSDYREGSLAVPPDLLASSNETVQANNAEAQTRSAAAVLPQVVGTEIKSNDTQTWLEIDADVEVVWRKLTEFWAYEGIELVNYNPGSGLMETDWFVRTDQTSSSKGFGAVAGSLFNTFAAKRTAMDKFNIRLERVDSTRTRLFVTHRGIKNMAKEYNNNWKDPEYTWVETEEDPNKVAALLQTIVLLFDDPASPA